MALVEDQATEGQLFRVPAGSDRNGGTMALQACARARSTTIKLTFQEQQMRLRRRADWLPQRREAPAGRASRTEPEVALAQTLAVTVWRAFGPQITHSSRAAPLSTRDRRIESNMQDRR